MNISKLAESSFANIEWKYDFRNPKQLINLSHLFEKYLNVDSSRVFANPKRNQTREWMSRGYLPGLMIEDVSRAEGDYQILREMFKLQ